MPGKEKIKLNYNVYGQGEALLCLHGNRDSSAVFKDMAAAMRESFLVICPDLRGHGRSIYSGGPFTIYDMMEDITDLLGELGIEKVNIAGHSLGSTIAVLFASMQPERVNKMVLMSSAASFSPSFKRPQPGETITQDIIDKVNQIAADYFFTSGHNEVQKQIIEGWASMPAKMHEMMIHVKHPDLNPVLHKIKHPVLLICGQEDKITPVGKSLDLNSKLPNSRLLVIPGAGHFVFLEEGNKIYASVLSFLKEM